MKETRHPLHVRIIPKDREKKGGGNAMPPLSAHRRPSQETRTPVRHRTAPYSARLRRVLASRKGAGGTFKLQSLLSREGGHALGDWIDWVQYAGKGEGEGLQPIMLAGLDGLIGALSAAPLAALSLYLLSLSRSRNPFPLTLTHHL